MPRALLDYLGYVIYFWIGDGKEPVHVHIAKGNQTENATKIWLTREGIRMEHNNSRIEEHDLRKLMKFVSQNKETIIYRWASEFGTARLKEK